MTVVSMGAKEFSRLDVLMDLEARRVTVRDACGCSGSNADRSSGC